MYSFNCKLVESRDSPMSNASPSLGDISLEPFLVVGNVGILPSGLRDGKLCHNRSNELAGKIDL